MLLALFLSAIAGLSTLIGATFILFNKEKKETIIASSLSFAAGVMLSISFIELIPEGYNFLIDKYNNIFSIILLILFIVFGIVISIIIDKIIPIKTDNTGLYKVGILSMIALIIHNIPEGIATFITTSTNIKLGITLVIAIAFHNIPEGISVALPIYYSTNNKKKAFFYTLISGLSEPLGALITFLFFKSFITSTIIGLLFEFIAGVMFYISLYELLPSSIKYRKYKKTFIFFIFGFLFVIITTFIF